MLKKENFYFSFILLTIFFRVLSAISSKYAAISLYDPTLLSIISNFFYILSLTCLFLNAIVWQQALMYYPLSYAYSFISTVNFIVLIASAILFNEGITPMNVLGMAIISVGITVLTWKKGSIA
jgi:multidrug transporter EmrE-like cation transporter